MSIKPYRCRRLTIDRLNDEGCFMVLCAMLKQMAKDYRAAFLSHMKDPGDEIVREQYISIREDFLSDYFHDLTRLDGRAIVDRLDAIAMLEAEQAQRAAEDDTELGPAFCA